MAHALPMPDEAPVITMFLFSKEKLLCTGWFLLSGYMASIVWWDVFQIGMKSFLHTSQAMSLP
jgi:hypothetical protein